MPLSLKLKLPKHRHLSAYLALMNSSEIFTADRTSPGKTVRAKKVGLTKADSLLFAKLWFLSLCKKLSSSY